MQLEAISADNAIAQSNRDNSSGYSNVRAAAVMAAAMTGYGIRRLVEAGRRRSLTCGLIEVVRGYLLCLSR
jgi:hypothetical protein